MEFMLDSGAYSAWTKGVKIDIDEYCEFIKKHKDFIDHYIVLDVIGDAEKSLEAQKYMESQGLSPLPVFHQGEDWKYLEYYANNYEYICISPLSYSANGGSMAQFLDQCFEKHVCDKHGMPKCKVHGLGLTTVKMMTRYPWYSVDSATWVLNSAFGRIVMPRWIKNQWKYDVSPYIAVLSTNSISKSKKDHYGNLSNEQRFIIDKWVEEIGLPYGKSEFDEKGQEIVIEEGLINNNGYRDVANALYFIKLGESMQEWPWAFKVNRPKGLFL
jgi:hypothetical protein